jgi:hypothetical protein
MLGNEQALSSVIIPLSFLSLFFFYKICIQMTPCICDFFFVLKKELAIVQCTCVPAEAKPRIGQYCVSVSHISPMGNRTG